MPFPGFTNYRSELAHTVLKELDEHNVGLNQFLSQQHGPNGEHTNVTADSIIVDKLTADYAIIKDGTINGKLSGEFIGSVIAKSLRLYPYKQYAVAVNDTGAFATETMDPTVSLWYANSTADRTIVGMFVDDMAHGRPGHVQVIINNSAFTHTYQSAVVTNARRIYGCVTPVVVPAGGTIWFVYDGLNLGWRFVGTSASGTGGGTIPPNIAFTNVANPWSVSQTFPGLAVTGNATAAAFIGTVVTPPDALLLESAVTAGQYLRLVSSDALTAQRRLFISTNDADRALTLVGNPRLGDWFDQSVKTTVTPIFAGMRVEAPVVADISLVSMTFPASARLFRLVSVGSQVYLQSGDDPITAEQGHLVMDRVGNVGLTGTLSTGPAFINVGGFRVDVTANCTIPGSGGGAVLPATIAYTDQINTFGPQQIFPAGITVQGVDWDSWLNQAVKTTSSPTFAGMTANAYSSGGLAGVTQVIELRTVLGGNAWLRVTNGIVTYFAGGAPPT